MAPDPPDGDRSPAAVWATTCHALGAQDAEAIARDWVVLESLYAHPPRHYHNLRHVAECLAAAEIARAQLTPEQRALVDLAILAHDCVYDARRHDNEARSAEVGVMLARDVGIHARHAPDVRRLVLATTHRGQPADHLEALVRDADLSSLASPTEVFDENTRAIRAEHAHVSDAQFRGGRLAFFGDMLARPSIYFTPECRDRFEAGARANLARAIGQMAG